MASTTKFLARPTLQFLKLRNYAPLSSSASRQLRQRSPPLRIPPSRNGSQTPQSPSHVSNSQASDPQQQPPQQSISAMLAATDASNNSLVAPVYIPEDPRAILKSTHPSTSLLEQSGIVVQRQLEMMNVFLGFEQANRYVIMDPHGNHIGYMAEHDGGLAKTMGRQWFRTHRAFTVHVFGRDGQEVLRFHRPFSWINTRIRVYDPVELARGLSTSNAKDMVQSNMTTDPVVNQQVSSLGLDEMKIIGEAQSEWAPLRRKYNLFLAHELVQMQEIGSEQVPGDLSPAQKSQVKREDHFAQFAYVDEPFLSWDFSLKGADGRLIGSVNRNWGGLGREFFTDMGTYVLRMDSAGLDAEAEKQHIISQSNQGNHAYSEVLGGRDDTSGMTLDQRAVMLATAVTVDFDYFSRHSHGGGIIPMPFMMGGGGAAEAGGAAGAAGAGAEAGVLGEAVSVGGVGAAGRAAGAVGAGEGAIAGAGTMAGYEAMQRGMGRSEGSDSPQAPPPQYGDPNSPQYGNQPDPQPPEFGAGSGSPYPPTDNMPGSEGETWGNDADPWSEAGQPGDAAEDGGIISKLWDMFNDEG